MRLTYDRFHELNQAFADICAHYGLSSYAETLPDLVIYHDRTASVMGEFEDSTEEISLNLAQCRTMRDAIATIVHEYQHYLQPRNGWYSRYLIIYGYDNHPYEIAANEIAARDWRLFYRR